MDILKIRKYPLIDEKYIFFIQLILEYDPEYPCIYKRGDESKIVRGDPINECPSNNTTVSNLPSSLYCSSDMVFELGSEKGPAVLVQRTISRQIEILGLKGNGR